ncbi:hypothetical protein N8838_00070 [Flavobacteriales bacterium]|nr:hypothetical protein [Flavobacteriales bacterium]|tara:strand:+ start:677 stop:850 length:174 start_codon:yes stop_codon:yes gene_type:complete
MKDTSNTVNNCVVKIGGESGSIDNISLYLKGDRVETKIIDGEDGANEKFKQVVVLSR